MIKRTMLRVTFYSALMLLLYNAVSFADTTVGGRISADTTWTLANSPYVVTSAVQVYGTSTAPVTLTIEPGVVVKFNSGTGITTGSGSSLGALNAVGTSSAPILFTSNQATPTPGYWTGITFGSGTVSANTILDTVTVEYGGNSNSGNIYLYSASPTIRNSTIRKSSNYGIIINSGGAATITGNTITNSGSYGIYDPSGAAAVISGNSISNSGSYPARMSITQTGNVNTYGTNTNNAVEVVGNQVTQNLTMKNNGVPYIIRSSITVYGTTTTCATLTIEPGVVVKFNSGTGMTIGSGSSLGALNAVGTTSAPILFTSNQATPTPGYWTGITFGSGTVSANTVLNFVTVEYGGSGTNYYNANLILSAPFPAIQNSTIRYSAGSGIYLSNVINSLAITGSSITGNKWGIYSAGSNPVVSNTQIMGNTTAGVTNTSTTLNVDARSVWWGNYTGPRHSSNPNGTGDIISNRVLYNPWLYQPPGSTYTISNVNVLPASFNPVGSYTTFTGSLSAVSDWTIVIKDTNQATVRTFTGHGTVINQQWYGEDNQSVKLADGTYSYTLQAINSSTGEQAFAPQGNLTVLRALPIALIDSVSDNQMVTCNSTISVTGTAADSTDFANYTLDYGAGDSPSSWTTLQTSTTQVTSGLLSTWNIASLTGNLYTLRLRVADTAANIATVTRKVRLLCIQNAAVSEGFISPNGDSIKDTTTITSTFSYPSAWTLTIKNASSTTVRTYTGTGTAMSQAWDGKDGSNTVVSDGTYTYQVDAVSTETSVEAASITGVVVVDTTLPTAQFSAPAPNTVLSNTVTITGTASDININTFQIEYGPLSGTGPWIVIASGTSSVISGTLATWVTSNPAATAQIQNGDYLIRLAATDKAGNSAATTVPINLSNLILSNVGIGSNTINTNVSETANVFFTINSSATVTFKIIPEKQGPTGTPVYQISQNCPAAGPYVFTWDGRNSIGTVVPDEAYLYILAASDGTRTADYSPAAPTGMGSVTCTRESTFSPYRNDPLTITYTVTIPERVTINVMWGSQSFNIVHDVPYEIGTYIYNWDGRNPAGTGLDNGAAITCSAPSLIRENHIITSGNTPKISELRTDPYRISLSYGQFTRILYSLSRDSDVTVNIVSSTGTTVATLVSNELQSAGSHVIEWRGFNPNEASGQAFLLQSEGDYIVTVQATNSVTGSSSTARAQVNINY